MDRETAIIYLKSVSGCIKIIRHLEVSIDEYAGLTFYDSKESIFSQAQRINVMFERKRKYELRLRKVKSALKEIPIEERRCLLLYYVKGYTYRKISEMMNISVRSFYRYKERGLNLLIKALDGKMVEA